MVWAFPGECSEREGVHDADRGEGGDSLRELGVAEDARPVETQEEGAAIREAHGVIGVDGMAIRVRGEREEIPSNVIEEHEASPAKGIGAQGAEGAAARTGVVAKIHPRRE
eukprot:6090156-Pyramimonas_sp.AAC.1